MCNTSKCHDRCFAKRENGHAYHQKRSKRGHPNAAKNYYDELILYCRKSWWIVRNCCRNPIASRREIGPCRFANVRKERSLSSAQRSASTNSAHILQAAHVPE